MESNPKYPTNNDVKKVIKNFSEVVSPLVNDMKQWLKHKELQPIFATHEMVEKRGDNIRLVSDIQTDI